MNRDISMIGMGAVWAQGTHGSSVVFSRHERGTRFATASVLGAATQPEPLSRRCSGSESLSVHEVTEVQTEIDEGAFEQIWQHHSPKLRSLCLRWMSGDPDRADEAFSRAGLIAFQKYPEQKNLLRKPEAWLTRLAYNICMDLHREQVRQCKWEVADPDRVDDAKDVVLGPEIADPEHELMHSERRLYLEHRIQELPPKLRAVMHPLIFEERAYREIAEHLAISEATLRKRVQEARALLRRALASYSEGKGKRVRSCSASSSR